MVIDKFKFDCMKITVISCHEDRQDITLWRKSPEWLIPASTVVNHDFQTNF